MRYYLTFVPNDQREILPVSDAEMGLNVASFTKGGEGPDVAKFLTVLDSVARQLSPDDQIVVSNEPLSMAIRQHLVSGCLVGMTRYDQIALLITKFILFFRDLPHAKVSFYRGDWEDFTSWQSGFLYGRYGIVEARVLDGWLRQGAELRRITATLEHVGHDAQRMYAPAARAHWLSTEDIEFNVRMLMTNAGFYFGDKDAYGSLELWAKKYYAALSASDRLFPAPGVYPNFFPVQEFLYRENGALSAYCDFPTPEQFYRSLAGRRVLFVTPFAHLINELVKTGKIRSLYTDLEIPEFQIDTIPAYISTYPNRPHSCWNETYDVVWSQVKEALDAKPYDLFFASFGCYGLPLCHEVNAYSGCTSVYYGNFLNALFGIAQASSADFMKGRRRTENWAASDLSKYANVNRIDGGRYV